MRCGVRFVCALVIGLIAGAPAAYAQPVPGETDAARVRIGPLSVKPTFAITNIGVDSNVFNQSDVDHPRQDFTITASPKADWWLRAGRSTVSGTVKEDFVYYQTYGSERSINGAYRAMVTVPFNRLTLRGGGSYMETRDRFGFEVDARAQHTESGFQGGADLHAFGKTFLKLNARRARVAFDTDAFFLGNRLGVQLDRVMTGGSVAVQHRLTPFTSVSVTFDRTQDRFEFSRLRDSDSTSVVGGVEFAASALVSGSAAFGYRNFDPLVADLAGYRGPTALVNLAYVAHGWTKLGLEAVRDIQFSYDAAEPYYVLSGLTGTIAQHVFGRFDGIGRMGHQRLAYRGRIGATDPGRDRVDFVYSFGGGIAYRVGREMRIGFNVDNQQRTSVLQDRRFGGLRYGTSVTYGF